MTDSTPATAACCERHNGIQPCEANPPLSTCCVNCPDAAVCREVYDYALGSLVVTCQRLPGHEGPHRWTGDDMMPNRVTLDWEPDDGE